MEAVFMEVGPEEAMHLKVLVVTEVEASWLVSRLVWKGRYVYFCSFAFIVLLLCVNIC